MQVDDNGNIISDDRQQADTEVSATSTDAQNQQQDQQQDQQQTQDADAQASTSTQNTEDKGAEPTGAEKRIKQLLAEKKRQEFQIAELQRQRAAAQPNNQPNNQEPQPDQFQTWEEYQDARVAHRARQEASATFIEFTRTQKFNERIAAAVKGRPEVAEALADTTLAPFITPAISQTIKESDNPADLILYLHDKPSELYRLSQLPPVIAAKELGKIEATIEAAAKAVKIKTVTQAPEPQRATQARGSTATDESKMSDEDWFKRDRSESISRSSGGRRK